MPTLASSSSKTLAALVARRSPTTTTGAPSARRLLHPSNSLPRFPIRAPIPVDASRICAPSAGPLGRSFASTTPPPPGGALPPNPPRLTTTTAGPSPISQTDPAALPELSTSSPLNRAVPPKRRSLIKRLLKATLWLNFGGFLLVVLGGGSLWVYYSYIAPARTIYRRGRDGLTYAVGAYDTTKSWYTWSRSWYGYLFLGEKGSAEDAAGRNDEVVDVRTK